MNELHQKISRTLSMLERHSRKFSTNKAVTFVALFNEKYKAQKIRILQEIDLRDEVNSYSLNATFAEELYSFVCEHPLNCNMFNFVYWDDNLIQPLVDLQNEHEVWEFGQLFELTRLSIK